MMSSRRVRAPRLADVVRDLEAVHLSEFPDGLAERAVAFVRAYRAAAEPQPPPPPQSPPAKLPEKPKGGGRKACVWKKLAKGGG